MVTQGGMPQHVSLVSGGVAQVSAQGPSSFHTGGVLVSMSDGSVRHCHAGGLRVYLVGGPDPEWRRPAGQRLVNASPSAGTGPLLALP